MISEKYRLFLNEFRKHPNIKKIKNSKGFKDLKNNLGNIPQLRTELLEWKDKFLISIFLCDIFYVLLEPNNKIDNVGFDDDELYELFKDL